MTWNKCDICGRFISMQDFEDTSAWRACIAPDSIYTAEQYATLCKDHNTKENREDLSVVMLTYGI